MKVLFALVALVVVVRALPYSLEGKEPEFAMVPTADGTFHLVNINEDPEMETFFSPETDVNFLLFTRRNPTAGQPLLLNNAGSVTSSNFNPAHPTRVTIHGWNNNGGSPVNLSIRDAFLSVGDFNVIVVDWGAGAQTINYIAARNRVGGVGTHVGNMINFLTGQTGINAADVNVIGHSLGAHVAGFVGKRLTALGQRLGHIVALDAALPLFNINAPLERVHHEDAVYVESIHTNGGLLGFDLPLGDSNFYPNFGRTQPGCGIDIAGNCAHGRAHQFYAESIITPVGFWARRCRGHADISASNCVASGLDNKMGGEPIDSGARGVYWLTTNNNAPFARGPV